MTALWLGLLAAAPPAERAGLLHDLVAAEFRTWLLMEESDELPLDQNYFDLGLTSLGAVGIEQKLETMFAGPIDTAELFDEPTVGRLLELLREGLLADYFPAGRVRL